MDSEELMRRKREIEGRPELLPELLPALLDDAIASVQTLEQAELRRMESFTSASEQLKDSPSDKEPYPTAKQMRADMVRLEDAVRDVRDEGVDIEAGDALGRLFALVAEKEVGG